MIHTCEQFLNLHIGLGLDVVLCVCVCVCVVFVYVCVFIRVLLAFVMFGLVSLVPSQEIGWDLLTVLRFYVPLDTK